MKKLFIVANWKSNKSLPEALEWFEEVSQNQFVDKEIIVCASYTLLQGLRSYILNHASSIRLAAQDISPFSGGAYTGEVNGKQIKEFAEYVLVGHSERQKYLGETRVLVGEKISRAKEFGVTPIVCVPNMETPIPGNLTFVAYEPPTSISPGIPDTPENANSASEKIKNEYQAQSVLYGGNVTLDNVKGFVDMPFIDGVLVGRASLDAKEFAQIIKNA